MRTLACVFDVERDGVRRPLAVSLELHDLQADAPWRGELTAEEWEQLGEQLAGDLRTQLDIEEVVAMARIRVGGELVERAVRVMERLGAPHMAVDQSRLQLELRLDDTALDRVLCVLRADERVLPVDARKPWLVRLAQLIDDNPTTPAPAPVEEEEAADRAA